MFESEDSSSRAPSCYSAGERLAVSPAVLCYCLVDVSGIDDCPANSVGREAKVSNSFVNPVEYIGEPFRNEEISNQSTKPVPVPSDVTASNSFDNHSLVRDISCEHSIVSVYSEPHSPSNASYNRDSSDASIADTWRKRRERRHKRLRFSRRESEHQTNCDNSWRVNKPIREPHKSTLSYPYSSKSNSPQYNKVSGSNKNDDARNVISFERVNRSVIHSSPEQEVYCNFSSCYSKCASCCR